MNMLSSEHLGPNLGLTTFSLVVKQSLNVKRPARLTLSPQKHNTWSQRGSTIHQEIKQNKLQNLQEEGTAIEMLQN